MLFINREKELSFLEQEYQSDGASFVVIYGRRRIGKTTLIKEFLINKPAVYFLATQEAISQNLEVLTDLIADFTDNSLLKNSKGHSWDVIIREFANYKEDKKKILVIDEFQYLEMSQKGFASVFQRIWDEILQNKNVMIVLCGSYISMMKSQTLYYSSPLYGRRTGQINLGQIEFYHYHDFFPKQQKDLIDYYSVTGGVPRYIDAFTNEKDLMQGIKDKILNPQAFLYEEPVFLLEKELKEIGSYFSILKTIAEGNHKLSRIASRLEVKQSFLSPYLSTLIEMDIVKRRVPVTEENPQRSKKGLYFIKDNFLLFWFRYCYPYQSYLQINQTDYVMQQIKKDFQSHHVSHIYENICEQMLIRKEITKQLGLKKIGKWWSKNEEIDIVGLNPEKKIILLAECKNTTHPQGMELYQLLVEKSKKVQWHNIDRKNYYTFFSRNGFDAKFKTFAKEKENVFLFTPY